MKPTKNQCFYKLFQKSYKIFKENLLNYLLKDQLTFNKKSTPPETQIIKNTFFQKECYCPP